jgi:cell division protein FtsB
MKFYEEEEFNLPRRRRQEPDFWHRLNRVVMTFVLVGFLGTVVIAFYPVWQKQHDMRLRLLTLERQLADKTNALQQNQREIDLLRHDADYLETIARDRLNLMKPGETIYRVDLPRS